jgi:hypothetical protein
MTAQDSNHQRDAEMEELSAYLRAIHSEWVAKRYPAIAAWEAKWGVSFQACINRARAKARKAPE